MRYVKLYFSHLRFFIIVLFIILNYNIYISYGSFIHINLANRMVKTMNKLNALRVQGGYTIKELSKLSGVSEGTICNLENTITTNPRIKTLQKLSAVLCPNSEPLDLLQPMPPDSANTGKKTKYVRYNNTGPAPPGRKHRLIRRK